MLTPVLPEYTYGQEISIAAYWWIEYLDVPIYFKTPLSNMGQIYFTNSKQRNKSFGADLVS